jgi:hypothetical protein
LALGSVAQIAKDAAFLKAQNVVDYSLLIGVHRRVDRCVERGVVRERERARQRRRWCWRSGGFGLKGRDRGSFLAALDCCSVDLPRMGEPLDVVVDGV